MKGKVCGGCLSALEPPPGCEGCCRGGGLSALVTCVSVPHQEPIDETTAVHRRNRREKTGRVAATSLEEKQVSHPG